MTQDETGATRRVRLNRQRVLQAAVALADDIGIEALSMRRLAQELGVVPMALYKHVANKDELLDGMVDELIGEIDPLIDADWRSTIRLRVLSARGALMRHPWARSVIESRTTATPTVLAYMDSIIGVFLAAGFSVDLTHHVMHALGSRMWGFTQEVFDESARPAATEPVEVPREVETAMLARMAQLYPNIAIVSGAADHDDSVVARGCDDQFEFEFALDLLLDGFARLHEQGWSSRQAKLSA